MRFFLLIPMFVSLISTLIFLPLWIKKSKDIGLVWDDMNKDEKKKIPGSGGIIPVFSFMFGILIFISYRIFFLETDEFLIEILAMLVEISLLFTIGFFDDLFGWRKGGIRIRHRLVLVALASIPLIAINSGESEISLPLIGLIDLGIIYPLLIIPLGVVGATTTFNFLAGFNGLEAGQGIIIMSALGIVSFLTGNGWLAVICFIMVFALFGFLIFNFYPAKVFPGDSMTYPLGGLIAIVAIFGNFEKVAIFFFTPYIIETFLKSRGKLKKQSFGKPFKDGSLNLKYKKIYGLTHLSIFFLRKMRIKPTEKRTVYLIWVFQIVFIVLGFVIFKEGIFLT